MLANVQQGIEKISSGGGDVCYEDELRPSNSLFVWKVFCYTDSKWIGQTTFPNCEEQREQILKTEPQKIFQVGHNVQSHFLIAMRCVVFFKTKAADEAGGGAAKKSSPHSNLTLHNLSHSQTYSDASMNSIPF